MKLSLAWIFDHIDADWRAITIDDLVARCTSTIAELERVTPLTFDLSAFSLARVTSINQDKISTTSPEWSKTYNLPVRSDIQADHWYFIHKDEAGHVRWATLVDFGNAKEGLLPAFMVSDVTAAGNWRHEIEAHDYIFEIDNKSITHRPDLWGHRGFAREIATLLQLPLKPESRLYADLPVHTFDTSVSPTAQNPIGITLKDLNLCSRFSGVYINNITVTPCDVRMALRLNRIDSKPINLIVDATNYVMFDSGQPMHAYDADKITSGMITPRFAHEGQKLELLDGQTITLTNNDLVICDEQTPIGLAGVMGGLKTAVTQKTAALFVESACFDATMIRHTAMHHKLRTHASARFEKSLDPEQTTYALMRFIKLMRDAKLPMNIAPYIISVGIVRTAKTLLITHSFIEKNLGTTIPVDNVIAILQRLGFGVVYKNDAYEIVVPSFRAQDVILKQDIVEEIGRFIGYQAIEPILPTRVTRPVPTYELMRMRRIKNYLAHTLCMHELANYAFFDEQFLRELQWQPTHTLEVANPLSEQWYRLVTSLIPHMIRAVVHNSADYDRMRFFECAKIWTRLQKVEERSVIAGIMFDKKELINFYDAQKELQSLFVVLGITAIRWQRVDIPEQIWFMPHQTADIMVHDRIIGRAGKINPAFLPRVVEGDAFIFELDATFLKTFKPTTHHYQVLSKYPDVVRDISFFIAVEQTAESLKQLIKQAHNAIIAVDLVDSFYIPEWKDRKALTFRYVLRDSTKTFTKQEADEIRALIVEALNAHGAQIR